MKKYLVLSICTLLSISNAFAQSAEPDFMRSIGKMYVVVAVLVAIFIGIIAFLIYMDRKISRLEEEALNK